MRGGKKKREEVKGLFEVGLPITVVASAAPANLGRVGADFQMYWRHTRGRCWVEMLGQVAVR